MGRLEGEDCWFEVWIPGGMEGKREFVEEKKGKG
jgi:hypothetical protein